MYYPQTYPQKIGIIKVKGEMGAQALQMMPNDEALLLDETEPLVWLAQTDGAGYKTLIPYKVEQYIPAKPVDVKTLEERIARLEEKLNESDAEPDE